MKKTIIRAIAIAIIVVFITIPSASAASITAPVETLNPLELFPMTLTPEELLVVLKEHEMEILPPGPYVYEVGEDGRMYEGAGRYFWYKCEGFTFRFFAGSEKMASIYVNSNKYATPEGIRVGDSRRDVFRTYGVCGKLIGNILDFFTRLFGKEGYDAKTKDGYYRFYFDGENKKCDNPLVGWSFYVDRIFIAP